MKAYEWHAIDYVIIFLGKTLLMISLVLIGFYGGLTPGPNLSSARNFILFPIFANLFTGPMPLKSVFPLLIDMKSKNIIRREGIVRSIEKRKQFSVYSGDKYEMTFEENGTDHVQKFTGMLNDLKEAYLPGDQVEINVMKKARIITEVVRVTHSVTAD